VSEFDSPWKEALEQFLPQFLEFFFLKVFQGVDWNHGYESLDKELQQIVREAELGLRLADKLFKVWRLDGEEAWVLIHPEVQNQPEEHFGERMYVYNYRIFDRFRRPVVSLAVLGDEQRDWRPNEFAYSLWGFSLRVEFPVVKLLDYAGREAELEAERNPFAAVVLAHLKSRETRDRPEERRFWKVRLVKSLFDRGLTAEEIRQLFRVIDWLLELPRELERQFQEEIHRFEEERHMPYVTGIERMAREEGLELGREQGHREALQQGIEVALELKFGEAGLELLPLVQAEQRVDVLRAVQRAIRTACTLAEVRELLR
jgi:hypothetical protein